MSKRPQPAVTLSAGITLPKGSEQSFAPIIIKYALLLTGCLGSVFAFLSCFDIAVSKAAVAVSAVISCGIFTFVLNMKPKLSGIASTAAAGVFLILTCFFRDEICGGAANSVSIYLSRVREQFRGEPFIPVLEPERAYYHSTVFFVFVTVLLSLLTAYLMSRRCFAAGISFPILLLPIAAMMFGLEPNYAAFTSVIAVCAASIAFEVSSSEKFAFEKCGTAVFGSGLAAAAIAALCFGGIIFAVKILDYERPQKIDDMYNVITGRIENGGIQNAINEIVTTVTIKKTSSGGAINHGKLGEIGDISFDGETVLRATLPKSNETVYLRGFVGSVYTGKSWEELPNSKLRELNGIEENFVSEELTPLLFDSYNLKYSRDVSLPKYSFEINNVSASRDYLYMPYNLVPESVSRYSVQGDSSFGGGENSYFGQYYDPSAFYGYQNLFWKRWITPAPDLAADEAVYRQFVYENYTELPAAFDPGEIFNETYYSYISAEELMTGKSTLDEMTVFNRKLYYIKKWLKDNCEYSLSAGKLPLGEDFVNYFLENKKGSCSHFASAAAIMCRYAGIPARYVEGYIVKPKDFPSGTQTGQSAAVDVTDARGHAWVEIYIDGFGWYPVEFTSGYGNIRTAIPTETIPETETVPEETETVPTEEQSDVTAVTAGQNAPSQTAAPETSAPNENETESAASAAEEENPVFGTETPPSEEKTVGFGIFGIKGGNRVDIYYDLTPLLVTALAVLAIPALIILRRAAIIALYRKKCGSGEKSAALAAYKKFGKLIRLMKLPKQCGLDYGEYESVLADRAPLLADGTAKLVINAALKASFGGVLLTEAESRGAVLAVNTLAKRYCETQNKFGKLMMKYFYCVV
ncbi:MAG: transglutaminase-like domain-containing protein [Muribaculaceae bacterium]|nr:transglutaminase-like domain-containing protein [Muribaculaceae bacterium]